MNEKASYRQWRGMIVVLVMVGVVSGCAVKIVYNQLDWLIPWYLSDYLDMNSEQNDFFDQRLQRYLAWHRKSQLPEYVVLLRGVADDVNDGLNEQEIQRFQNETERLASVLMVHLAPDVVAVFAGASDEQLAQLYSALDKDGERYRKRYIKQSLQQQQESQVADVIDTIERWTGGLSDEQELLVSQWGAKYQPMGDELYQAGLKWRAEFKQALKGREDAERYSARLTSLLTTPDFGWSDAFKLTMLENKQSLSQLYFALDKTFSKKQRKRIINTLLEYAGDFEQLAKEDG
ncbi:MAG: hypothetical protein KUG73_02695 [Pseudomonadales bacterium]|nr:hypothetical protein [Pseudomonadales bacterium]